MKEQLDQLYAQFDIDKFKKADPCGVVYQLMEHTTTQADIEIGALFVAMISWGSRKVIIPTALHMIRDEMKWKPEQFIRQQHYEQSYQEAKNQCVYRTLNVETFKQVCRSLRENLQGYDTIEQRLQGLTTKQAVETICQWLAPARIGTIDKSACKRVCMYLRWMIRKETPDLNIWKTRTQQDLYAVMDTHVCQLAQPLFPTPIRPTWKTCEALTQIYKKWNPKDPLKYDIALMMIADKRG